MDNSPPPYELEWFEVELLDGDRLEFANREAESESDEWVDCDLSDLTSRTRASREPVHLPPLFVSKPRSPAPSFTRAPEPPPLPPRKTLPFRERPKSVWSIEAYRGHIISLTNSRRGRHVEMTDEHYALHHANAARATQIVAVPPPPAPPKHAKNTGKPLFANHASHEPADDAELGGLSSPRIMIVDSKRAGLVRALTFAAGLGVAAAFALGAVNAKSTPTTNAPTVTATTTTPSVIVTTQAPPAIAPPSFTANPVLFVSSQNAKPKAPTASARASTPRKAPPHARPDAASASRSPTHNATSEATDPMLRAAREQTDTALN